MKNLTEANITDAVLKAIDGTQDARAKEVMTSLIRHLQAFAREVRLTQDEWETAIGYLYDTGQITGPTRNEFVLTSDVLGISLLLTSSTAIQTEARKPAYWDRSTSRDRKWLISEPI